MAPTAVQFKEARTPTRSPIKTQRVAKGLTENQKRAIIENLQLEVTERARKLRAQYALQAQTMRARLEIRINRIPVAMRNMNIGELAAQHLALKQKAIAGSPAKNRVEDIREKTRVSPSPRPKKRKSDEMSIDKENQENQEIEYPKKRARAPNPAGRAISRETVQPSQVLSPRSANSRSYQRTQTRNAAQSNPVPSRPVSPLKSSASAASGGAAGILTNMVEKAKATRGAAAVRKATGPKKAETKKAETKKAAEAKQATGTIRGRKTPAPGAAPPAARSTRGRPRTVSDSSDTSNGTVVRKPVAKKEPAAKRTVMGTIRGMGGTAKKAAAAPAPKAGGTATRVLRKRN
ncbi:hypothetical protein HYFRA_00012693 [Hymenoscyphus fraxineus]|uniref:Borealin N-terminal domain-containing protein n=1 Tax=Hymenoscyphus fraxineus TaxID=746836 RepID=A0A9N9PU82_9HELO|nr:hypothetical protein HYFRA_00012693 [Hymenoscyphus fraxineus]